MRILFVGGGSIGHVAPSVAVWRALQVMDPKAEAHFVCSERQEEKVFLEKEGIAHSSVQRWGRSPLRFLPALMSCWTILTHLRPDVIFNKGGSLGVPMTLIGRLRGIPVILHESDAVMGRANRLASRWANVVCWGFPRRDAQLGISTGNPIRPSILQGSRERGLRLTGLSGERPILLVFGGSQGSATLNDAVTTHLDELLAFTDIVHLTGRGKDAAAHGKQGYWSRAFVQEELPDLYAVASLALSRAGAGSIGELAAWGIPAILVPLRGVAHDHQQKNAEVLDKNGACVLLPQTQLQDSVVESVRELLGNPDRRRHLSASLKELSRDDSASVIARLIVESARQS